MWQQQQAQAQAAQQAEDRQLAQTKAAAYQSDLMNAPVASNMPGLMQSGAVGGGSSDPRALQQVAGGTMPGMNQPGAMDYARIAARHGDPTHIIGLQKAEETNRSREEIQNAKNEALKEALGSKLNNAIEMLKIKSDTASQLQAQKLESMREMLQLKADLKPPATDPLDKTLVTKTLTEIPKLKAAATSANTNLSRINTALELAKKGVTGKGGQVKALLAPYAEMFGVKNTEALDDAQKFQLLTRVIVGPMRLDIVGPGPVSEWEQKLMQQISGGGGASRSAAIELLSAYKQMAEEKINSYNSTLDGLNSVYPKASQIHKPIPIAKEKKRVVERRVSKTGKTLVKYDDGTIGEE